MDTSWSNFLFQVRLLSCLLCFFLGWAGWGITGAGEGAAGGHSGVMGKEALLCSLLLAVLLWTLSITHVWMNEVLCDRAVFPSPVGGAKDLPGGTRLWLLKKCIINKKIKK